MAAFWRDFGRIINRISNNDRAERTEPLYQRLKRRGRTRNHAARTVRSLIEALEDRKLLSTIPGPIVDSRFILAQPTAAGTDYISNNTPSITYDPVNPNKMVAVWVSNQPYWPANYQHVYVQGAYTTNAGATWNRFNIPGNTTDPTIETPPTPFDQATEPSVAMDRDENVYIVYRQHNVADTAGRIVLQKYDFSGGSPQIILNNPVEQVGGAYAQLYGWYNTESAPYTAAYWPTIAVDANVPVYVDPSDSTQVLTDPYVGNVYVAWATYDLPPSFNVPNTYNPNSIRFATSSDSGASFGPSRVVNAGGTNGLDRNTTPRIVISQGTWDGRIAPGRVTVVWDDTNPYNVGVGADRIMADGFDGGRVYNYHTNGGAIKEAIDGSYESRTFNTGSGPQAILWDDFDGANLNDILTINNTGNSVTVLLNDGQYAFADGTDPTRPQVTTVLDSGIGIATNPVYGLLSDLDRDGVGEVVVICSGTKDVWVLERAGGGTFTVVGGAAGPKARTGTNPVYAVSANVDPLRGPNNNLDIIVVNRGDLVNNDFGGITILPGRGDGTFDVPITLTVGEAPTSVAADDFDGDGLIDLAVTTSRIVDGTRAYFVDILIGDGLGGFVPGESYLVGNNPVQIAAGRLEGNNDPTIDLVVVNAGLTGGVYTANVLLGNGDGTFLDPAVRALTSGPPRSLTLVDIDGDGATDVLVPTGNGQVHVLFNGGQGQLADSYQVNVGNNPYQVVAFDQNGEGMLDMLVVNRGSNNVTLLTSAAASDGAIPIASSFEIPVDITDPAFVIGDLDVEIRLTTPDLNDKRIELIAPNGRSITLVQNRVDNQGNDIGNPPRGLTGTDLGADSGAAFLPTIFDSQASLNIWASALNPNPVEPWVGRYQPETGTLNTFNGMTAAQARGTWTLRVTDYTHTDPDVNQPNALLSCTIRIRGREQWMGNATVATTGVRGTIGTAAYANAADFTPMPARGVGPSFSIASDNTLGLFSPYQGRIYLAYTAGGGDNTDIELVYTDDAFQSANFLYGPDQNPITGRTSINDDVGSTDGFSESNRAQFQPTVAVDQSNGTVVLAWYDARHDGSRTRVATYIATSITGGAVVNGEPAFGTQVFANRPWMAVDAITLESKILGPIPDNQGAANAEADATFGFGDHQGMVAVNGHIYPVWAGNLNGMAGARLGILGADLLMASGPRIVSSTMGPVSLPGDLINPALPGGSPQVSAFEVVFDRPIDPSTFTPADITVIYRDTTTSGNTNGVVIPVKSVVPQPMTFTIPDGFPPNTNPNLGATTFIVNFQTPQTATGTYSYFINPNVNDRIRQNVTNIGGPRVYSSTGTQSNLRVPAAYTGGETFPSRVASNFTTSTITVPASTSPDVITDINVEVWLAHSLGSDLVLQLIAPDGTTILLSNRNGAGANFNHTVFDDDAATSITAGASPFAGSFQPEDPAGLAQLIGSNPAGNWQLRIEDTTKQNQGILYSWTLYMQTAAVFTATPAQVNLPIPTSGTGGSGSNNDFTTSTITITGVPTYSLIEDLNVNVTLTHPNVGDLVLTLLAPDGITRIPLAVNRGPGAADFTNTTFDDQAILAIGDPAALAPFTGSFRPDADLNPILEDLDLWPLSAVNGFSPNGTWTLQIQDAASGNAGTLVSWSLEIRTGTGNRSDQNANSIQAEPAVANTSIGDVLAIPTPTAQTAFNGSFFVPSYTQDTLPLIVPGPHVISTSVSAVYPAPEKQVGLPIPAVGAGGSGNVTQDRTTSTFTVSANPATTINDLNVVLSLSHSKVGDLKITLIGPDGTQVILADHLGANGQNYIQTVFDDGAAQSITTAAAPFTGAFRPQQPLSAFTGRLLQGQWTLRIEDTVAGDSGTLLNWRIEARTTNPLTGENLILDNTINSMDVVFDRDMTASTFTPEDIVRMVGPVGQIKGPFTITPNPLGTDPDPAYPRTFRIGFPTQELSGTYTVTLASTIASKPTTQAPNGEELDTNLNAGVDMLRGIVPAVTANPATTSVLFPSTNVPLTIGSLTVPGTTVESQIVIPTDQGFPIQYAKVQLDITYAYDPDLEVVLVAPDGAQISLFWGVGLGVNTANFNQTIFVDELNVTPIANGAAPFRGTFSPRPNPLLPEPLHLSYLYNPSDPSKRINSAGTWTLRVKSNASGRIGSLNSWSLTFDKPLPSTGLGEHVADQTTVSARVFTQDPTNPLSHNVWTSVGPASNNSGANSGRISGLAVDPSDPSGNTVYVGGASGGVWKTSNFLTSDPLGPTYVPLTDFGPVFSLNVGTIAIFPRNNDPTQSVIITGTGEGDTRTTGVGFLRSTDAGTTWELLDSRVNYDATGQLLPIDSPLRDHVFVGTTVFKVVVDPRLTPSGDIIIYAAVTDPVTPAAGQTTRGGIWRSLDSGRTWEQMRAGANACDVMLDLNSGYFDQYGKPTGNLQIVYGAFEAEGVFKSPNRGQSWFPMTGDVGNPLLINRYTYPGAPPIAVAHPAYFDPDYVGFNALEAPNGANIERIVMAKPAITNDPVMDLLYQGWVYVAAVSNVTYTPTNSIVHFANVYITKDYGENWTRIRLPIGSNDTRNADYNFGGNTSPSGYVLSNYNLSIAVDPNNASVVYVGGVGPGLVRVDITNLSDAHSLFRNSDRTDGGSLGDGQPDPVLQNPNPPGGNPAYHPMNNPITYLRPVLEPSTGTNTLGGFISLISNPFNPFSVNASVLVGDTYQFANSGAGARNMIFGSAFGSETNYQHRLVTLVDPLTGRTRIIFGCDTGVGTGVDNGDGSISLGIGTATATTGDRNGNLGITQFFYGAAQPSKLAAQAALSLFYGNTYHNGYVTTAPDVLTTGDINWNNDSTYAVASDGSGGGVATDGTGSGTVYTFRWPEGVYPPTMFGPPNNPSDFFTVRPDGSALYIGRTNGLLQTTTGPAMTYDPQWVSSYTPLTTGSNFAVNPINKEQIIISSTAGRIFGTENQGKKWVVIGDPTALDGTYAPALAYGAPDPQGPGGPDTTNFFLYAGTVGGRIFVTFTGGGANGNAWIDLSNGLDGSPVRQIVTNPMRGTHEAFAVTEQGIYHMPDSTAANASWVDITGNIFFLSHNSFNLANDTTIPSMIETTARQLTSIQADWRYVIPDSISNLSGPTHPVLYVSSNTGVYRSLDKGLNWSHFPDDVIDGSPVTGGYLPSVEVTDLDISLGNINPTTGREDATTGISTLLASTFGRGAFAIRLAPVVAQTTLLMDASTDTGTSNSDQVTKNPTPTFTGLSQQSAFGNRVRITLLNMNDPNNPVVIGGFSGTLNDPTDVQANWTDEFGRFAVSVYPGALAEGTYTIGVRATDDAGTVGGIALLPRTLTYDNTPPTPVVGHNPIAFPATEGFPFTGVVAEFSDTSAQCLATIDWGDGTTSAGTVQANPGGWYDVIGTHTYTDPGTYTLSITITDPAGNDSVAISATATVSNPAVVPAGGLAYTVSEGDNFASQPVATFIDPGGAESLDNYSATIDWGDGTTSAGAITYNASTGVFTVSGGHFFPDSGVTTITTSITHDDLTPVTATSTMTVQNVAPSPTFTGPQFGFATFPASFTIAATDMSPADQAAGFTYSINWGDGSAADVIPASASNGSARTVTHAYAQPGTYQAVLSATDKDGGIGTSSYLQIVVTDPTTLQDVSVNPGELQRSIIKKISFRPSYNGAPLATFSSKNLVLMKNGNTPVSLKGARVKYSNGAATVFLDKVKLPDGDYQLQVALGGGIVRPIDFHKLEGDTDGDRAVGKTDYNLVKKQQGYKAGQTGFNVNADLNGNGVVDGVDLKSVNASYGHSLKPRRITVSMSPSKTPKFPTVDFGSKVKTTAGVKIIELNFTNTGAKTMKLKSMSLADASGCLSFGVLGTLWAPTTGAVSIPAGGKASVRIYLTPTTPQTIGSKLNFSYSLDGKKFAKGTITIKATIV